MFEKVRGVEQRRGPNAISPVFHEGSFEAEAFEAGTDVGPRTPPDASLDPGPRVDIRVDAEDGQSPDGTIKTVLAAVAELGSNLGTSMEEERKRAETSRAEIAAQLQAVLLVNKTLTELVEENRRLRSGEHEKALEPVLRDLVSLAEDLNTLLANTGHPSLKTAASLVTEILERYGATEIRPMLLERFDPARHKGVGRLPTDDRSLDGTVAELVAPGYSSTRTVLLYPRVNVFRYGTS